MGVVFDKLVFMRKLEGGGEFTRPQAERLTDAFYDAVVESVATKQGVGDVRTELKEVHAGLKHDVAEFRSELKHEVAEFRSELKHDLAQVRSDMTIMRSEFRSEVAQLKVWAAGTGAAVVSLLTALKFFA